MSYYNFLSNNVLANVAYVDAGICGSLQCLNKVHDLASTMPASLPRMVPTKEVGSAGLTTFRWASIGEKGKNIFGNRKIRSCSCPTCGKVLTLKGWVARHIARGRWMAVHLSSACLAYRGRYPDEAQKMKVQLEKMQQDFMATNAFGNDSFAAADSIEENALERSPPQTLKKMATCLQERKTRRRSHCLLQLLLYHRA